MTREGQTPPAYTRRADAEAKAVAIGNIADA
nr:MAG TPA: hypothetical protein [Caudoviricetes sp.]